MNSDDWSLSGMERQLEVAKGSPLTPDELDGVKKQYHELQRAQAQLGAAEKSAPERAAEAAFSGTFDQLKREVAEELKQKSEVRVPRRGFTISDMLEKMKDRLANKDDSGNLIGDPEMLGPYLRVIAKELIHGGINEREPLIVALYAQVMKVLPGISREKTRDILSGHGYSEESDGATLGDIKEQANKLMQLEKLQQRMDELEAAERRAHERTAEAAFSRTFEQLKREAAEESKPVAVHPRIGARIVAWFSKAAESARMRIKEHRGEP